MQKLVGQIKVKNNEQWFIPFNKDYDAIKMPMKVKVGEGVISLKNGKVKHYRNIEGRKLTPAAIKRVEKEVKLLLKGVIDDSDDED